MAAGPKLFSERGVEKTSVREWARVNSALVSDCFGGKTGLYRALFTEPPGGRPQQALAFADPALPVDAAMRRFHADIFQPLNLGRALSMAPTPLRPTTRPGRRRASADDAPRPTNRPGRRTAPADDPPPTAAPRLIGAAAQPVSLRPSRARAWAAT